MEKIIVYEPGCVERQNRRERHGIWIASIEDRKSIDFVADEVNSMVLAKGHDFSKCCSRITYPFPVIRTLVCMLREKTHPAGYSGY